MAAKCIRTGGLCAALCSGALALLVPCVGKADDVLPAATYTAEAEYYVNGYVLYQYSGNVYGTDLHFDGGSVPSGTLGIQPSPFATVIGSSPLGWGLTPNLPFGVSISDSVTVYMEIPGVSISTLVPVDVVGLASGSVSGSGIVQDSVSYTQFEGSVMIGTAGLYECNVGPSYDFCGAYDGTAYLHGDTLYGFTVSVSGSTDSRGTAGTFQAANDPTFEIDPTFLADNPGVQLEESPGVGNTETPEPGTLTLLASGLLGLAGAVRRKVRA